MKDKILFIGPKFFGYEKYIIKQLKCKYEKVIYVCEYPLGASRRYYIFETIFGRKQWLWNLYENKILKIVIREGINKIFIIRGRLLPESLLKKLVEIYRVEIIHYQWDSVKNNPNALVISKYANKTFTFDMNDAKQYPHFNYLPLFYYWEDEVCLTRKPQYDLLYVASCNLQRLEIYDKIKDIADRNHWRIKSYLFLPFILYIKLLIKGENVSFKDVRFNPLSHNKYQKILQNSHIVVDVPSSTQVGSSMRTIEALSLGKKIITTNSNVLNESFYCKDNIILWNDIAGELDRINEVTFNWHYSDGVLSLDKWIEKLGL